ncbi:MAG: DUF1624 domain-containing protein [Clostridia bacterium]|nr:DUF1624 domain-containing protein [Clostridia bacterium]
MLDHLAYDLSVLDSFVTPFNYLNGFLEGLRQFGIAIHNSTFRQVLHYFFAPLFLVLTGISTTFTKNKWRRLINMALLSAFMTAVTTLIGRVSGMWCLILFGVLHCMTVGLTLVALIDLIPNESIAKYLSLGLGVVIIVVGILIPWYEAPVVSVSPFENYFVGENFITYLKIAVGVVRGGADCLGIFPCAGFVLVGNYLGKSFYAEKKSLLPQFDRPFNRIYCTIGRNTVWIYLLHQVVIAGMVSMLGIFN